MNRAAGILLTAGILALPVITCRTTTQKTALPIPEPMTMRRWQITLA